MEQQSQKQNNNSICDENRMKASNPPNVWIVTLPFYSHFLCGAQLGELVAKHGLSVTLFAAMADIQRFGTSSNRMVDNWKHQGLDIEFQPLGLNSFVGADFVGGNVRVDNAYSETEIRFEEFLKSKIESGFKPTCVISDFTLPAALMVAASFNIPSWPFITLSLGYVASLIYSRQLESKGIFKSPSSSLSRESQEEMISLPGLPLMRFCDLSPAFFKDNPLYEYLRRRLEPLGNTDVVLVSGFRELEPRAFHELQRLLKSHASKNFKEMLQVWPIGPTCPFLSDSKRPSEKSAENSEVHPGIRFLDSQPPRSVVYVAFGTDVNLSEDQFLELVDGLESSQQPFLCALQLPKKALNSDVQVEDVMSIVLPACLERIKSRSLFVKWAPQMEVLSHPSTGAFISHCGFNSLLESVSLGVPILAWPIQYEQFMNCRILVDEANIALEVCPGLVPGGFVTKKEVEKSITTMFHSDEGRAIRDRALQMKKRAEETVGDGGSSRQNMLDLVALIQSLAT